MGEHEKPSRHAYLYELDEHPGEDCFVKGLTIGGKAALIGALYGSVEAAVSETPTVLPGFVVALKAVGRHAIRFGTVGAAFACTTCFATGIRQKDDYKNWALGGVASGTTLGLIYRKVPYGVGFSVGLAVAMGLLKLSEVYKHPYPEPGTSGHRPIDRPW